MTYAELPGGMNTLQAFSAAELASKVKDNARRLKP
jgi:hypothetical protein